ncbi:hypothetical protein [Mucilaginibacter lappiensis]|uniref:Outer membrane protein beta-barrel domain-containing protein n=1 Tax=Mucilaginibacter lappiensis TaxID=354630 RepID=A0A841JH35_9SPHI|nr:hypothetical protein [Mucilaginibacter lappiensis]MBB6127765.1 hypothetical protein [Mucilaginibacter lappiensis]
MKGKNENKLDQLFKDGLSGSEDHIAFREEDWASMERLLDNKPSKKAVIRRIIYYSAAIAAILLLAVGLFFFNRNDKAKNELAVKPKIKTDTQLPVQKNNGQNNQPAVKDSVKNTNPGSENLAKNNVNGGKNEAGSALGVTPGKRSQQNNIPVNQNPVNPIIPGNKTIKDSADKNKTVVPPVDNNNNVVDPTKVAATNTQKQNDLAANTTNPGQPDTAGSKTAPVQQTKKDKPSLKPILRTGPRFTLAIMAAPDLNAVNSFNRNQVGTNFGVQLGIHLSKKLSISTGASYAVKPYQATGSQYNSIAWQGKSSNDLPDYVSANCKVLDIPLNLNYQFYAKGRNKFAIGSGLSSYIMLRENYHFSFADGSKPSYDVQVDGRNQHWLGVLNLNATYERRINSKFSTIIQPYMKLPVTGIGVGRVDLRSTGVAVGVSWNINPFRPK